MALTLDAQAILKQYENIGDDFGFSTVSEEEYNTAINNSVVSADDYKTRLQEVEKLIIPFLQKLYSKIGRAHV